MQVEEKKIYVLSRLRDGDRIIWQEPNGCARESVWFMDHPQLSGFEILGVCKFLRSRGMIAESIAPARDDEKRRWYQTFQQVYAATDYGLLWLVERLLAEEV